MEYIIGVTLAAVVGVFATMVGFDRERCSRADPVIPDTYWI
jgi:hypothetical protein